MIDFYMNLLINHTWKTQASALPNPSVGALILDSNNAVLSIESHQIYGESHAELKAFKSAYIKMKNDKSAKALAKLNESYEIYDFLVNNHNRIFYQTSIFVTLEPCNHIGKTPSCAKLLSILKPKNIFISSLETNSIAKGGVELLKNSGIEVKCKVLEQKGYDLLLPFTCLCQKKSFILYKIAQRLNGSFKEGAISSMESQIYSHKLRNVANRIIISQKTILNDNSILDSRFIQGKAPNIAVVGKTNNLNKSLKIFSIPNRKVNFFNNINSIPLDGFNIVEGGADFFNSIVNKIDCMLVFISPNILKGDNFYSNFNGRILHSFTLGKDVLLWIQKN